MKAHSDVSAGGRTLYPCPASPLTKFARVNTVLVTLASQTETSVTFAAAPAAGTAVDIYYGPEIVLPPATYTASGNGAAIPPLPAATTGLTLFLNVTAVGGTAPTLNIKLQVLDQVSGVWMDVPGAAFATVTAITSVTFTMFPGAINTANVSLNQTIRNIYRAVYTLGGTTPSFTLSLGAQS